jgi:hypothetical protein
MTSGKTIAFYDNNLTYRGTSVAVYNYADYNEKILGGKSIIMAKPDDNLNKAQKKFENRFPTYCGWWSHDGFENFMTENKVDYFYSIRAGNSSDGPILNNVPTLVHAVFCVNNPHGDKYAYISDWLARYQGYDPEKYSVPFMVEKLPKPTSDLREKLGIPKNQIVFGCYGGSTEFNISFVHQAIKDIASQRKDITFLFMNINSFSEPNDNIIHLPGTWDLQEKSSFINACDAMLHARYGGETFGLACGEFALENKPIITYKLSTEANHIEVLSDWGIYYSNYEEILDVLNNFQTYKKFDDYFTPYLRFSPKIIMDKFQKVFLT